MTSSRKTIMFVLLLSLSKSAMKHLQITFPYHFMKKKILNNVSRGKAFFPDVDSLGNIKDIL